MTESSADLAALVALRVAQRLALDAEEPRLSVSIGIAEFPRDGATIEHLLSAADQSLYNDKRRSRSLLPHVKK
jgi:GGDEF domain-containing protein